MAKKPDLIIVDTNLWVSFLLKRSFAKLYKVLISGHAKLVFSEELLAEFIEVSGRPKFKKYLIFLKGNYPIRMYPKYLTK